MPSSSRELISEEVRRGVMELGGRVLAVGVPTPKAQRVIPVTISRKKGAGRSSMIFCSSVCSCFPSLPQGSGCSQQPPAGEAGHKRQLAWCWYCSTSANEPVAMECRGSSVCGYGGLFSIGCSDAAICRPKLIYRYSEMT